MATISGGSGDDTLTGTSGNDTISGGDGSDSIEGGAGNDYVYGGGIAGGPDGNDVIDTGDGDDIAQGGLGDDTIRGGTGSDTLGGEDGNDFIDGGDDADTIYGNDGDNTLLGGAGDDLIYGGADSDTIRGGAGNDQVYGQAGADTFIVGAGSGIDVIEDYSPGQGDMILIDYPGIASYADLQPYLSDDGNYGTLITFPDGSVTQLKWHSYAAQSASDFSFASGTVCFLKGTRIETAQGPRPVEALRPGDLVLTLDHGLQRLRFVSLRTYRFGPGPHRMKPVRIRPGALAPGVPGRELIVSPQHRIALPQTAPDRIVAARRLLGLPGVSARPGCRIAHYHHLLMDRHELVRAEGAWAETLLVTGYSGDRAGLPAGLRRKAMMPVRPIARKVPEGTVPG